MKHVIDFKKTEDKDMLHEVLADNLNLPEYYGRNLDALQKHVKAGFVLSCVGDDRTYSYLATKYGDTLTDRVLQNVLKFHFPEYKKYSFLDRGSDERQYGSAGVNLPVCGFCRSLYTKYPEYHTSADNMDLISPEGLQGAYDVMVKVIMALENNYYYAMTCQCEPQLGKRGLYPTISYRGSHDSVNVIRDFTAYADGSHDLIDVSNLINVPIDVLIDIKDKLKAHNLITA